MTDFITTSVIAVIACLFCIRLLRPLAIRIGFVDRPTERKLHEHNTPLVGGIAIFFGFCFSLLMLHSSLQPYRGMLAGSSILILMGVVDDFSDLSSRLRLLGQVMAALMLASWGHVLLGHLGHLLFTGNLQLGMWALPVTVFLVVANFNAINMIDGQDGLAGGVALGQALLLLLLSIQLKMATEQRLLVILIMLLLVFLAFNMRFPWRKRASVFLGDSGSTFVAFLLAWFAIDISQHNLHVVNPIAVLWIMAFPLFDLLNVTVHRISAGKSIFKASRDQFHHILHSAGVSTASSTRLLCALSFGLGSIGFLLAHYRVHDGYQLILFLSTLIMYFGMVQFVRKRKAVVC
jgi:UDP-GlcNAc:undecaprenyl-phosphate GlcNAc-1-phosphate transferase